METISHSHNSFLVKKHPHFTPGRGFPTGWFGIDGFISKQLTYLNESLLDFHKSHSHRSPSMIYEKQHTASASSYNNPIQKLGNELWTDGKKLKTIESKMYVDIKKFHTGYGSPWKEIYVLKDKIDDLDKYATSFPRLQWLGEKHSMLNLMQIVLTYTVDAKFAIVTYHDWIQRAYDHLFNGNNPSIVWDNFEHVTIGNRLQKYDGNVKPPGNVEESF
jgi:hypothetical protein